MTLLFKYPYNLSIFDSPLFTYRQDFLYSHYQGLTPQLQLLFSQALFPYDFRQRI